MLQHHSQLGTKVILPWCLKQGGTPKWLPSILERCIIGWLLCVTYAGYSPAWTHRAFCTTILDVKPSVTWQRMHRTEGTGMVKKSHKKKSRPRDKRRHPRYLAGGSPKGHKRWNATQHFPSSPTGYTNQFTFWISLDHPGFIVWVGPCSIRWTVISFFSHNVCAVMVLMLIILSYVSFALMFHI